MKREDKNDDAKDILATAKERGDSGTAIVAPVKRNDAKTLSKNGASQEEHAPESLPASGSVAEERLRISEHEEGKGPARQGEERERE